MDTTTKSRQVLICSGDRVERGETAVVEERPLTIHLNGRELVTLLTDFSHPDELALGFLHSEGLLDRIEQVRSMQVDERAGEARIEAEVAEKLIDTVYGKRLVTTGCGKGTMFYHVLDSVKAGRMKVESDLTLPLDAVYVRGEELSRTSEMYKKTHGVHGAALLDAERVLVFREDIGRHNALDKLSGWALRNEVDPTRCAVYTTGRITSEVMLKAGRMSVPIILSRSAPTELALQLGEQLGLTVVGYLRGRRCRIFLNPQRIEIPEEA